MSWILQIDTALDTAIVSISKNGKPVVVKTNQSQKDHASFLQPAIAAIMAEASINLIELSAIAVVEGPGSYTGLRVGMASAKGLCYALNKPLITIGSLELLAALAINQFELKNKDDNFFYCPMIDARRMEVFTAVYDKNLNIIFPPCSMVLDKSSYVNLMLKNKMVFFGNGSEKWLTISDDKNAHFINIEINHLIFSTLSFNKFQKKLFADIVYTEPAYIKDFFTTAKI